MTDAEEERAQQDAEIEPRSDDRADTEATGAETLTIGHLSIELTNDGGIKFASVTGDFVEFTATAGEGQRFTPLQGEPALFEPAAGGAVTVEPTVNSPIEFDAVEWGGFKFEALPSGGVRFASLSEESLHLEPTHRQGFRFASTGDLPMSRPDMLHLNENTETPPPVYGPE